MSAFDFVSTINAGISPFLLHVTCHSRNHTCLIAWYDHLRIIVVVNVAVIVLGAIIFIISFMGFCGAWKESSCLITSVSDAQSQFVDTTLKAIF